MAMIINNVTNYMGPFYFEDNYVGPLIPKYKQINKA